MSSERSDHASYAARLAGARPGDWIEVHHIGGGAPRRGQILDVLGTAEHPHFHVRWDESTESLHYPAEGDRVLPRETVLDRSAR